MAATLVLASSNVTTACRFPKLTSAWLTPETCDKAFLSVMGQTGQSMDGIAKVTVFGEALTTTEAPQRMKAMVVKTSFFVCDEFGAFMCVCFQ